MKKISCKLIQIGMLSGVILLSACSNDDTFNAVPDSATNQQPVEVSATKKEQSLVNFAGVLSKATYSRKDVRAFLKQNALKQFDKNYDVLYYLIKDEMIGEESFRDILVSYSSQEEMEEIEANIPLVNILIPEIAFFDITPENMDVEDAEIPVAISKKSETSLFLNGEVAVNLEKGEVPDFHVFVVNENSRVVIPPIGLRADNGGQKTIAFKSPNFDGSIVTSQEPTLRSASVTQTAAGAKAIEAYQYFYADDGSINQAALQRDYIYYGITPQKQSGTLNRSVSEYISFLEINPNAYFKISDQKTGSISDDPAIKATETSQKSSALTEAELIDRLWTKGAYDFRFEIVTSTNQHPQIIYIPLKPSEIWNFNLTETYQHKTWGHRSKYTYKIDPYKFTSKRVYLNSQDISFGKWNLAEESLYRYVNISEEDEGVESTYTTEYETSYIHTDKFKGDAKLEIGIGEAKVSGGAETEASNSNTVKATKKVSVLRKEKSDDLGSVRIYFYDPLIEKITTTTSVWGIKQTNYYVRTYNTGTVTFAITVK